MGALILTALLLLGEGDALAQGLQVYGGLGLSAIDDTLWLDFCLTPEFSFDQLGVGLNLPLRYNPQQGIRRADYNTRRDYARWIRYLRWGNRGDPFFFRIGRLEGLTFGQGLLLYRYQNRLYEDEAPKVGLYGGGRIGSVGIEAFTGDLGRLSLVGLRMSFTPLVRTRLPLLRNLEWGISWVRDFDPDENRATEDGITAYGMDLSIPLIPYSPLALVLYAEAGKLQGYGQGGSAGMRASFQGLGLMRLDTRLEYRRMSAHFLPAYFGPFYEVERTTQATHLDTIIERHSGVFGELAGEILGKISISGTYQYIPGQPHSGILHFEADLSRGFPTFGAKVYLDRRNIESSRSLIGLDENTLLTGEARYRLFPFLSLTLLYRRTFHRTPGGYKPRDELAIRAILEKP